MLEPPVVIIVGPTAAGKTALACAVADLLGDQAQLISADSAMVYRGMDIGTAKPSAAELRQYPHELIDIRDPSEIYTVADFVDDADKCVAAARAVGRVPIIVGGTMLYVKRFVEGIAPLPPADPALREQLAARLAAEGGEALHAELNQLDPAAAVNIHPNNQQRLLRALEVVMLSDNRPMSEQWQHQLGAAQRLQAPLLLAGLMPAQRSDLHTQIEARFTQMLAAGFLQEVSRLYERADVHGQLPSMRAVGYRQAWQHLAGELSYAEFVANTLTATRRLAKRQLTWMRGWSDLPIYSAADLAHTARELVRGITK